MEDRDRERLSGALQENLLTLLCFDDVAATLVRAQVTVHLFESAVYREVAGVAIDFLDQYGVTPKEHLTDLLGHLLNHEERRKAEVYKKVVTQLFASREGLNRDFVLSQLTKFVRAQNIKSAIVKAAEAVEDGRVDDAEVAMHAGLKSQINTFELGIDLGRSSPADMTNAEDEEPFLSGIHALDAYGVGPARKTLFMLTAPLNRGKSWGLIHIGKWGLLQRLNVVHVTLEMSARKTAMRYYQSFFSISKREAHHRVTRLRFSGGELASLVTEELTRPTLADPEINAYLARRLKQQFRGKARLIIKEFATGRLDIAALEAYLDGLQRFHNITPDLLIIDYADLMRLLHPDDKRGSIGQNFVDLRGLAVDRNMGVVTASQVNRTGMTAKVITEGELAEDFSKGFTVDTNITYNQTEIEEQLGLARIYVSKHRDEAARMTALITQSYGLGQFCLDSVLVPSNYQNILRPGRESADAN